MALLLHMAGLDMTHVPYRGTALAMPGLIAGRLAAMTDTITSGLPFVREGRVRAPGVSTRSRLAVLPDVPAIAEFVPGQEVLNWYGISGPAGLPADVMATIHAAVRTLLARPAFRERLASQGMEPLPMPAAEYAAYLLARDRAKWKALVPATGRRAG